MLLLSVIAHRLDLTTGEELPVVMARVKPITGLGDGCYVLVKLDDDVERTVQLDSTQIPTMSQYWNRLPVTVMYIPGIDKPMIAEIGSEENIIAPYGKVLGWFCKVIGHLD